MNASADDARRVAVYRPDGNRTPRPLLDEVDVETRMQRVADGLGPEVFDRVRLRLGLSVSRLGELIGLPVIGPDTLVYVGRVIDLSSGTTAAPIDSDSDAERPVGESSDLPGSGLSVPALADGQGVVLTHVPSPGSAVAHGFDASGRLHGAPADRLAVLERIADYALAVLENEAAVARWFDSTVHALGGRRPLDCLDSDAGRELVLDTLGAIEYGHVM